jgi:hypothetical protein
MVWKESNNTALASRAKRVAFISLCITAFTWLIQNNIGPQSSPCHLNTLDLESQVSFIEQTNIINNTDQMGPVTSPLSSSAITTRQGGPGPFNNNAPIIPIMPIQRSTSMWPSHMMTRFKIISDHIRTSIRTAGGLQDTLLCPNTS